MTEPVTDSALLRKYDTPAPRYTSYPTVPYWSDTPTAERWLDELRAALAPRSSGEASLSVYVHLPFCEALCTYCGCNTSITKDHGREQPYLDAVLKEWSLYLAQVPDVGARPLRQLHLGGGTPTFFSPDRLARLVEGILSRARVDSAGFEGSIEVDPRHTTREQLARLREFGFNRVSMGVQDFAAHVQKMVNRIQPFEITERLTLDARELGYASVNYDLIYGLPKQTRESIRETIELTIRLRPDRIALYSMALVPWIKPVHRIFKDEDLPKPDEKRALYEVSRELLLGAGYVEIGMDHFALPDEALALARGTGQLHRNFMGYTDQRTDVLLGLGVSSISETPGCFHQNDKVLHVYERIVGEGRVPTFRGHVLSASDRVRREQILRFMTTGEARLEPGQADDAREFLSAMIEDGLVALSGDSIRLTERGRPFLRNACMFFDERLRAKQPETRVFSRSI